MASPRPTLAEAAHEARKNASAVLEKVKKETKAAKNNPADIIDAAKASVSSTRFKIKNMFSAKSEKPTIELTELDPFMLELNQLQKKWSAAEPGSAQAWMLQDLMSGFTAAKTYFLSPDEKDMLIKDIQAANRLVAALDAFTLDKDLPGPVDDVTKTELIEAQAAAFNLAEHNIASKRPALSMVGAALGTAAITAGAIALLTVSAPVMPFIVAGCFIGGVALLAFSAINHYRLTHCSFYGQNEKNHAKMHEIAQIAANEVDALDKQPGCLGR